MKKTALVIIAIIASFFLGFAFNEVVKKQPGNALKTKNVSGVGGVMIHANDSDKIKEANQKHPALDSTAGKHTNGLQSQIATYKSIYLDEFKLTYFRELLRKSYSNSNAVQEIINADHSGFTELILTLDDCKLIDDVTSADYQKIQADSANNIVGRVAEGAEGKHALEFIIDKMNSTWLDSLSHKRYEVSDVKNFYVN